MFHAARGVARLALSALLAATGAMADPPAHPVEKAGQKGSCVTPVPKALLNDEQPGKHAFNALPENHAVEKGTFADGAQLDIDVSGCQGPVTTKMVLAIPAPPPPDKRAKKEKKDKQERALEPLAGYLTAHQDAFARTPLGLPGPAKALEMINTGKVSYDEGDKLCFDKDVPAVVPTALRCGHAMTLSWTPGPKRTYTAIYVAEP